jgi:hypothetical protein
MLFPSALLPASSVAARETSRTYAVIARELASLGVTLGNGDGAGPLITNFPIWAAEALRTRALALPDESPTAIVDLANHFGAHWLVLVGKDHGRWPQVLSEQVEDAACFQPTALPPLADPADRAAVEDVHVYKIACPETAATP